MANTRFILRAAIGSLVVWSLWPAGVRAGEPRTAVPSPPAVSAYHAVLEDYCFGCHNSRLKTGGLALDALGPPGVRENADTWEKVVRKLRLGVMPPVGVRRPEAPAYEALVRGIETELDAAAAARPAAAAGRPVLRRLNRAEYANAIRDLLGLDVDVAYLLPPDDAAYGFDNVADAQASSPALLQAYLAAARKISALAAGDARTGPGSETYSARQDLSQDQHLEGLPLGTVGGLRAQHIFPVDGEYDFQIRLYRTNLNAMRGLEDPQELELTLDGGRLLLAKLGGPEDLVAVQKNPTEASDAIETTRLRIRTFVKAGTREIGAAFLEKPHPVLETNRLQRFLRDFANPYDAEGAPHVQSITVQGPYRTRVGDPAANPRIFACQPRPDPETGCARRILSTLARRAYRRPLSSGELDDLVAWFTRERATGTFQTAIQFAVRRILASPSFVFRPEAEPPGVAPGTLYRVSDVELASRLSFFLWSSIPDDELLRLGENRSLHEPDTLARQVRRMLGDRRAEALVRNFAGQWLQLRNLRGIVPNSDTFPDFDDNLRQSFAREAELLFRSVIDEDRSLIDLLNADDTFVDERLARHYGIPGVYGSRFRRIHLADDRRRGLLGKGAILLVTSHATTTSPVLRGKWVLENLLGAPPPPPPPDVPALADSGTGAAASTMRQQMEQHRSNPACAACHKRMDPIGFALENFDVVGAWRDTNDAGIRLDTTDVLADGSRVDGVVGLREALLKRSDIFVQTFTEKLMTYALGRGLTADDMPSIRRIVRDAKERNYRFSSVLLGVVNSVAFRMRRSEEAGTEIRGSAGRT
jgi:mono/diheme cytochrome c family protein